MDNARRKLRVCLICVVMAAVVIGRIYYFNDMRDHGKINEGTLVEHSAPACPLNGFTADGAWAMDVQESRG